MSDQKKKDTFCQEIETAIRARIPVIWIETSEESRTVRKLIQVAKRVKMMPHTWTATEGRRDLAGNNKLYPDEIILKNCMAAGKLDAAERRLYIMKDASAFLADAYARRAIRDEQINGKGRDADAQKVFIFIDQEPPPAALPGVYRASLPLPDLAELAALVDAAVEATIPPKPTEEADAAAVEKWEAARQAVAEQYDAERREAITAGLIGLTSDAARDALLKSRAVSGEYKAADIAQEKKQLINNEAIQWIDPDPRGAAAIGGLDNLKNDLETYRQAMTPAARAWGLPPVKGILSIGIPGSGKSLTAKAAGTIFELPTIRLNVAALFGKFVGDSEANLRAALATVEAVAPCILFIDEVEKALAGAGAGESGDSGTSTRVFGEILTWMNDKEKDIFIIATANDIRSLPPEFKRRGRFDGIYFLDTPNRRERLEIIKIMAAKFPKAAAAVENPDDLAAVATAADGYTGAEIEAAFSEALREGYKDGERQPTAADIIQEIQRTPPLAESEAEALASMKKWAAVNAKPASVPDAADDTADDAASDFRM